MVSKHIGSTYIWNSLGSIMNAAMSVILFWAAMNYMGAYVGGIFSLAYAVGQQFLPLGAFEVRPFQATDLEEKYSFKTYCISRFITVFFMFAGIIIYFSITGTYGYSGLAVTLIASLKLFDAIEDVFHGAFQRIDRLDCAGKALFFRSLLTTTSFCIGIFITRDLLSACIICFAISLIALIALNVPLAHTLIEPTGPVSFKTVSSLLICCFPLFLGTFFYSYLPNAPRFCIAEYMSLDYQAYYNALFMPSLLINLLSSFIFRPLLTQLAASWQNGDSSGFYAIIARSLFVVVGIFIIIELLCYICGIPLLNWFFNINLDAYRIELMILVAGGLFNAFGIILYYALVVLRKQLWILASYAIAAIAAFLLSTPFISSLYMLGASLLYLSSMALCMFVFLVFFLAALRQGKNGGSD